MDPRLSFLILRALNFSQTQAMTPLPPSTLILIPDRSSLQQEVWSSAAYEAKTMEKNKRVLKLFFAKDIQKECDFIQIALAHFSLREFFFRIL